MATRTFQMLYLVLAVARLSLAAPADADYHDTLDDNHDFETVMKTSALRQEHVNCYVYDGPCNPVMASYKTLIPSFMAEACARCNPPQKHMVRVWFDGLETEDPEGYVAYLKKYDPENKMIGRLRDAVAGF